ncbi:MAG: PH domain-containing protein [Elusimicrobiota bacterium]
MNFEAKRDFTVKLITNVFNIGSLIPLVLYFYLPHKNSVALFVFSIMIITSLLTWLFSPVSYQITETKINILRPIKNIEIELSKIKEIRKIEKEDLKGAIRLFGSGGLYGFFGLFYKKGFGKFYAYCSNPSDLVLIKSDKLFLISPSQPEVFISYVKEKSSLKI